MKVRYIIEELRSLLKGHGIDLYFGEVYDSKLNKAERAVHLMPFSMKPAQKGNCYHNTTWNMKAIYRRQTNETIRDQSGLNADVIDETIDLATLVIDIINNSDVFLITQKQERIALRYYPSDLQGSMTLECIQQFEIPVQIWKQ